MHRAPRQFDVDRTRWSLQSLKKVCDWLRLRTVAGLSRLLKRLDIHYKRARDHIHSPDPDYLAKLHDIHVHVQRSKVDPELVIVLFQDEFTFYRQPTLASAYEISGHQQPLAERSYHSNNSWRVSAAIDIWTGRVVYIQKQQLRLRHLIAFLCQVRDAYPTAQTIYMVVDNWPCHFHPDVLAALEPQNFRYPLHLPPDWPKEPSGLTKPYNLPIQLVPLPTYASWANPIEKLWRKLRQDELHLHRKADDWPGLRQRVVRFLDQFAQASRDLLRYVGLQDPEKLYHSALSRIQDMQPLRE